MQELFAQVLHNKDLSKAGELFSLEDKEIQNDLTEVLRNIRKIVDTHNYATNSNDQSVVEICVTRVTSAIRETHSIEQHLKALVDLLEICLEYNLQPTGKEEDSAHAKIASDVLSCLFMNYTKRCVMQMAIPVVVRFLDCENKELIRNVSSYLSLAAIEYSSFLAAHTGLIINSILKGNFSLLTLLLKVFPQNKRAVLDQVSALVILLDSCDVQEQLTFMNIFGTIAKENPVVLQPYMPMFCDHLKKQEAVTPLALGILVDLAVHNPRSFVGHTFILKGLVDMHPVYTEQVVHILSAVGTVSEGDAKKSLEYFVSLLKSVDKNSLPIVLQGIHSIGSRHPHLLAQFMPDINKHSQKKSSQVQDLLQQLRDDLKKKSATFPEMEDLRKKYVSFSEGEELRKKYVTFSDGDIHLSESSPEKEVRSVSSQTEGTVTIITVGNPPNAKCPSDTVSVKHTFIIPSTCSLQSLGKTTRVNSVNSYLQYDSPSSVNTSDCLPAASSMASSLQNQSAVSSLKETNHDTVQHFCEKHLGKIRVYINNISARVPLPAKCCVVNGRHKRYVKLNFLCGSRQEDECLYNHNYFMLKTKIPKTWIHLIFLAVQAKASSALSQHDISVSSLKACWDALKSEKGSSSFLTVVTSSFPSAKEQDALLHELHSVRYFDVFEFSAVSHHWACFLCNHPEKMLSLLQDGDPVISGQLKEKKGRWKMLKRWKTRYFSLSGANITYTKSDSRNETLPISKIQSVKAVRKGLRDIPRAFEIFTGDQTYVLKAKDEHNVEQWVQCLQIAVARSQKKERGLDGVSDSRPASMVSETKL